MPLYQTHGGPCSRLAVAQNGLPLGVLRTDLESSRSLDISKTWIELMGRRTGTRSGGDADTGLAFLVGVGAGAVADAVAGITVTA